MSYNTLFLQISKENLIYFSCFLNNSEKIDKVLLNILNE